MSVEISEKKENAVDVGNIGDLMVVEKKRKKCKIKWLIGLQICTTIFIMLMIETFHFVTQPTIKERQIITYVTHNESMQKENIVTLYALDPLARTFCFGEGVYGHIFSDWNVYNRRSDIDFNNYYNGSFSVGIEGSKIGVIIDLGSNTDLQKKYKYGERVGKGQGFASIHRKNETILIE
jgi:hypothetical protein